MSDSFAGDTSVIADTPTVVIPGYARPDFVLNNLLANGVLPAEDWHNLDAATKRLISGAGSEEQTLTLLIDAGLLTSFQAAFVRTNRTSQLVLGNYRLVEEIGNGGAGVVFRAEHILLRRPVAIKVLRGTGGIDETLLRRFFAEMRALARVRHPNVVWALDGGTVQTERPGDGSRHFLVMEYVAGTNLEVMAAKNPMPTPQACELIFQIAGALDETHKLNLVHRDIKPSNILVTPHGVAKLLDFGLALHFGRHRLTMPGTVLGTLCYMAPEQVTDPANVDIRADIFGLGTTLFYCLTGMPPFPAQGPLSQQAAARMVEGMPEASAHRADIAPELDTVLKRMMAFDRNDRYPTPQSLLRALLPFVNAVKRGDAPRLESAGASPIRGASAGPATSAVPRILLVDDHVAVRQLCKAYLRQEGFPCTEANDAEDALRLLANRPFDLVLLDVYLPGMSGAETLTRIRRDLTCGNLKVFMMSGRGGADEMSAMLALGADDYLVKPFTQVQIVARIKAVVAHKAIQDRAEWLNQELLRGNAELEQSLSSCSGDLTQIRQTLLYALVRIVESRTQETPDHLVRVARYAKALALKGRSVSGLASLLDDAFVQTLERCAPLHDIGNVAMPDHILHRGTPLSAEDRIVMQAHTTIGADTLAAVAKRDQSAAAFWRMAIEVTRHHHERYDGTGYPDRLTGRDIPLSARLVALADAYDTLRVAGHQGVPLSHNAAVEMIVAGCTGRFDPVLVHAFQAIEEELDAIFRAHPAESRGTAVFA